MKVDNIKKLKDKTSIRAIDIAEQDMVSYQYSAEDTVPSYALVDVVVNPFFNAEKIKEMAANVVDLLKGTRNIVSLQYDASTVIKVLAINFALSAYVMTMDAALQMTKLVAYNDSTVMRYILGQKFSLSNAEINNLLNNRAEYEDQVKCAKAKIKSRMLNLGHFEEMLEQIIYDFRFDDQAQYTTKVGFKADFLLYNDGAGNMVSKALAALFGGTTPNVFVIANRVVLSPSISFSAMITTPGEWFARVESCCESLFADTEYHAFRTEYMNLYLQSSLWEMKDFKIKSYFNDSDYAVLMNASPLPFLCRYVDANANGEKYEPYPFTHFVTGVYDNSVQSIISSNKTASLLAENAIDANSADVALWMPAQNNGFGSETITRGVPGNTGVGRQNKIINIHKPACARDAEFEAICGFLPSNIIAWNDSDNAKFIVTLGALSISGFQYIWSNHYKDGRINFTNTTKVHGAPYVYRCYQANISPTQIRELTAAYVNVNGLPPLYRVFYNTDNKYYADAVQEQYDLYDLTPATIYIAQRALQAAWISSALKISDNVRAENFAELLDQLK